MNVVVDVGTGGAFVANADLGTIANDVSLCFTVVFLEICAMDR